VPSIPAPQDLPFVDVHDTVVAAPVATVWECLTAHIPRFAASEAFARVLAAEPVRASGKPLDEGATLPGFAVAEVVPGSHVRLAGRHRFSRYALDLSVAAQSGRTVLSARTYAAFPGLRGRVYRQLVIGSGVHRVMVRRLLAAVRRDAEAASA
jgi:hypothetical protein